LHGERNRRGGWQYWQRPFAARTDGDSLLRIKWILTDDQKPSVDKIVAGYQQQIATTESDATLSEAQRQAKREEIMAAMARDIRPFLTAAQAQRLATLSSPGKQRPRLPIHHAAVSLGDFFPAGRTARSLFSNSEYSYDVDVFGTLASNRRSQFGYGLDDFGLADSDNKLWVLSPQASYARSQRIADHLSLFEAVSGGPAYMDYSFNVPDGAHFGAKRIGLDGGVVVGLRYGMAQVSVSYRFLTQPTGVDFDGLAVAIRWVFVRF
jgi:hypothetical protein